MGHFAKLATIALILGTLLAATLSSVAAAVPPPVASPAAHTAQRHPAKVRGRSACARRRTARRRAACSAARRRHRHRRAATHRTVSGSSTGSKLSAQPSQLAATAAAATAAAVLAAAPCQNTQLTPEGGNLELARSAVLCLINQVRAQNGLAPLRLSHQLEAAAESHAAELVADDYFAHISPSGETPVDRIRTTGYIPGPSVGYLIGENLAWGTFGLSTPQSIVNAWIASPGHLANILEAGYSETGIGVSPAVPSSLGDGAPGATYAQEFGVIVR